MNAAWNAEQREWLQAMGFDVLVPATATAPEAAAADARTTSAVDEVEGAGAPVAPRTAPMRTAPDLTDPLLRALLRASRCDDVHALAGLAGDLASLRRDPAAKRALWPALRALRARGRSR